MEQVTFPPVTLRVPFFPDAFFFNSRAFIWPSLTYLHLPFSSPRKLKLNLY